MYGASFDSSLLQPEVLLKNVRLVERDVETASESSNSPNSAKQSERFGSNKSKFGWLTEWRVRTAIASVAKYQVLRPSLSFLSLHGLLESRLMTQVLMTRVVSRV